MCYYLGKNTRPETDTEKESHTVDLRHILEKAKDSENYKSSHGILVTSDIDEDIYKESFSLPKA